jgi:hypothetical protein
MSNDGVYECGNGDAEESETHGARRRREVAYCEAGISLGFQYQASKAKTYNKILEIGLKLTCQQSTLGCNGPKCVRPIAQLFFSDLNNVLLYCSERRILESLNH